MDRRIDKIDIAMQTKLHNVSNQNVRIVKVLFSHLRAAIIVTKFATILIIPFCFFFVFFDSLIIINIFEIKKEF